MHTTTNIAKVLPALLHPQLLGTSLHCFGHFVQNGIHPQFSDTSGTFLHVSIPKPLNLSHLSPLQNNALQIVLQQTSLYFTPSTYYISLRDLLNALTFAFNPDNPSSAAYTETQLAISQVMATLLEQAFQESPSHMCALTAPQAFELHFQCSVLTLQNPRSWDKTLPYPLPLHPVLSSIFTALQVPPSIITLLQPSLNKEFHTQTRPLQIQGISTPIAVNSLTNLPALHLAAHLSNINVPSSILYKFFAARKTPSPSLILQTLPSTPEARLPIFSLAPIEPY